MPVISGKTGTVKEGSTPTEVFHVMRWTLEWTSENDAWGSNQTAGYKNRVCGILDWTASIEVKNNTGKPPFSPGDALEIELHVDDTGLNFYDADAVVASIGGMVVDMDSGGAIGCTVEVEGNGVLNPNGSLE
jgi:hypothetical protein